MTAQSPLRSAPLAWFALLLALPLFAPSPAQGQVEHWGVKTGGASMTGTGEGLEEEFIGRNTGFLIGGTTQIGLVGPLSLRPELLFVRKGWSADFGTVSSTVNLDYLEFPVLADVAVASIWGVATHVHLGPTFGVKVNSGVDVDGDFRGDPPDDMISRTEISLAVGGSAGTEIGTQTLRLDVRYRLSLTNINERRVVQGDGTLSDTPSTIRNRGLSVAVGVVF